MSSYSLRHLSDDAVTRELEDSTGADRRSIAAHIARIAEYDRRELYLPAGYKSMFRYCVGRLRLSEDAACQRIRAARVARLHPAVFDALADGRLNLTTVGMAAPRLTGENAPELLAAIAHQSIKQVRQLLAERFGPARKPRLPQGSLAEGLPSAPAAAVAHDAGNSSVSKRMNLTIPERSPLAPDVASDASSAPRLAGPAPRALLSPVAPGVWELVALLGQEACDQLEACRELLGHAVPSGDLAEILERAIALQLAQLRKRRCGATEQPRASTAKTQAAHRPGSAARPANPRYVPRSVRREVWERDGGRCTFVGTGGHRCEAREELELDHVVPVARGGLPTASNLRLLCGPHNRHAAERTFGKAAMQGKREAAQRRRIEERLRKQADRERTEARRAEMARQADELGVALRTLGYRGEELRRALALCAERAEATLEERLRHALGRLAPNARREAPVATMPG